MKTTVLKNLLLTSTLAFGLTGGVYAHDDSQTMSKVELSQRDAKCDMHQERLGFLNPQLIGKLNLTEAQKSKFDEVKEAQRAAINRKKTINQQIKEQRKSLLAAELIDLKALLESGDQFTKEVTQDKVKVREKVLAFWDSLDKEQKIKVTQYLKSKQEHLEKLADKHQKKNHHHVDKHEHAKPMATETNK